MICYQKKNNTFPGLINEGSETRRKKKRPNGLQKFINALQFLTGARSSVLDLVKLPLSSRLESNHHANSLKPKWK